MKEILREIGMIGRCCATISDIEFKDINLAKGQYLYLVRIYENPGFNQDKIANILKVDRSTAAKSIKKLIESNLIKRVKDDENKKEFKLYCTQAGIDIYFFLKREEIHSTNVALLGLNDAEKKLAYNLLHKMRLNIEKEWEDIKKGIKRSY